MHTKSVTKLILAAAVALTVAPEGPSAADAASRCTAARKRVERKLDVAMRACSRTDRIDKVRVPDAITSCTRGAWQRYASRLAKAGCTGRPVVAAVRSSVSVDDLADADRIAAEAHAAFRRLAAKMRAAAAAAGDDPRLLARIGARFRDAFREAVAAFDVAEQDLAAVEEAYWSTLATEWRLPSVVRDPLEAALVTLQIEVRRLLGPSLASEIAGLRRQARCRGDLIGDRLIERYGRAALAADGDPAAEVAALSTIAAQLVCISNAQANQLDAAIALAYRTVQKRLARHGLERLHGALARVVAPLQVLVLDTVKHYGEGAYAWRWFVDHRATLADEVRRHGWATDDVVWLYDRRDGNLRGFPPCDGDGVRPGRCADAGVLLDSLVDPRALGAGDCALSGMVAAGARAVPGGSRYACPSGCADAASGGTTGTIGRLPSPGAIGGRLPGSGGLASGGGSSSGLPWSNLSSGDLATMKGFCDGGSGAGGGSGGGNRQGPGGVLGDWGGQGECLAEVVLGSQTPWDTYTQCLTDAVGGTDVPSLGSDLQGVPADPKCGIMNEGGTEGGSGGGTAAEEESTASKIWSWITSFFSVNTAPSATSAVVDAEIKLLDPENGKKIYDTTGAIIMNRAEQMWAAGDLSDAEWATLQKMKPGDVAEYLDNKKGGSSGGLFRNCADELGECSSSCTAVNTQLEAAQECDRQLMNDLDQRGPGEEDLDSVINPAPDAPSGDASGQLGALLACMFSGDPTADTNPACGIVTCADGLATSRSGNQCCVQAGSADVLPVGRLVDADLCHAIHCGDTMAASMDAVGNCGCGVGGDVGGAAGGAPAPTPGPSPERATLR